MSDLNAYLVLKAKVAEIQKRIEHLQAEVSAVHASIQPQLDALGTKIAEAHDEWDNVRDRMTKMEEEALNGQEKQEHHRAVEQKG